MSSTSIYMFFTYWLIRTVTCMFQHALCSLIHKSQTENTFPISLSVSLLLACSNSLAIEDKYCSTLIRSNPRLFTPHSCSVKLICLSDIVLRSLWRRDRVTSTAPFQCIQSYWEKKAGLKVLTEYVDWKYYTKKNISDDLLDIFM